MEKEGKYAKSIEDLKEYIQMYYKLIQLNLLEKLSQVIALIIIAFVTLLLLFIVIIHFSFALVYKLASIWHSQTYAALAVGGGYLLVAIILLIFRDKVFVNPIVKHLSRILFDESDNEKSEHETEQ